MKRKLTLLLTCLLASISLTIAQTSKKVTGVVFSEEDNQPVIGASVVIKGTSIGTTTDLKAIDIKYDITIKVTEQMTIDVTVVLYFLLFLFLPISFLFHRILNQFFGGMKSNFNVYMAVIIHRAVYICRIVNN